MVRVGGYYGRVVAGPVFSRIMSQAMRIIGVTSSVPSSVKITEERIKQL